MHVHDTNPKYEISSISNIHNVHNLYLRPIDPCQSEFLHAPE